MPMKEMSREEIDQFLSCARVGRLGVIHGGEPYVVPVGFVYCECKIFIHTCGKGLKMEGLAKNPNVCFEVDEALSDTTMSKSVILLGRAEIIHDEERMTPYLQKLIDKYRVPISFDEYMRKPGRNRESELRSVRICAITPTKITGRKLLSKEATGSS